MRRVHLAVALAAILVLTVSCTADPRDKVDLDDLAGRPLDVALMEFSEDDRVNVIDASGAFSITSTYNGDPGLDAAWIVGAACSTYSEVEDDDIVELAVIPREEWEKQTPSNELKKEIQAYLTCGDA